MKWRAIGTLVVLLTAGCGSVTEFTLDVGIQAPPIIADYFPRLGVVLEFKQEVPTYVLEE